MLYSQRLELLGGTIQLPRHISKLGVLLFHHCIGEGGREVISTHNIAARLLLQDKVKLLFPNYINTELTPKALTFGVPSLHVLRNVFVNLKPVHMILQYHGLALHL